MIGATEPAGGCVESASPDRDEEESPMSGKLLKTALIAPIAALLLMLAAPAPAQAANEGRGYQFRGSRKRVPRIVCRFG